MTSTSELKKTVKGGQEPEVRSPLRQQQRFTRKRISAEVTVSCVVHVHVCLSYSRLTASQVKTQMLKAHVAAIGLTHALNR